jgi:hypothetical protein
MEAGSSGAEIWRVLPLRPRPQPLESLTGYITRLAESNGLQSLSELGALAGGTTFFSSKSGWNTFCEYSTLSYSGLVQITGIPPVRWLDMTFFHLIGRFGRSVHPITLQKFLVGSIAPILRYCPSCLAEHNPAYYSLLWRFLVLPGCIEHGVHFLDQCCHCGSTLPLLSPLPQLTMCPACRGDLRSAVPEPLENSLLELTQRRTDDLKMLLTPSLRPQTSDQSRLVGKRFQSLRLKQGLLIPEVASLMDRERSTVLYIDAVRTLPHSGVRQPCLNDYVQYADVLRHSLCQIFDEQSLLNLCTSESEEQLLGQVEQAIHQLQARGKLVLPGTITDLMAMSRSRLRQYPRIKKLLNKWEQERKRELFQFSSMQEEGLLARLEPILQQLETDGEPLVLERVCHLVGLTYRWAIRKYPRVKALLHEYRNRLAQGPAPQVDEETKVREVQAAIDLLLSHGEPVTLRRIRGVVNLTYYQLRTSLRVKALLRSYTDKRLLPTS